VARGQLAARASGTVETPTGRLLHACARAAGRVNCYAGFGLCYALSAVPYERASRPLGRAQAPPDHRVIGTYCRLSARIRDEQGRGGTGGLTGACPRRGPPGGRTRNANPNAGVQPPEADREFGPERVGNGEWGEGGVPGARCGRMGREPVDARPIGDVNGIDLKVRQTKVGHCAPTDSPPPRTDSPRTPARGELPFVG